MGTRSTVSFYSDFDSKEKICSIYQQYDGYIDGVGHELANFLKDKTVVNGFSGNQTMENGFANGMGCLAAQYISNIKDSIGGVYLTKTTDSQDYDYHVKVIKGNIVIEVDNFKGSPEELLNYEE